MKLRKYIIWIMPTLFFLLPNLNCTKDNVSGGSTLNPNTWSKMSCKISGKILNDCQIGMFGKSSGSSSEWFKNYVGHPLKLFFVDFCNEPYQQITVSINNFNFKGTYQIDDRTTAKYSISLPTISNPTIYNTVIGNNGSIEITNFDTIAKKVSGTFHFSVYNDSNETVEITEGIFKGVDYITN